MDNMMASRVMSRFLPVAQGDVSVSVYDGMRREIPMRQTDVEGQRHANTTRFHDAEDDDDNPDAFLYQNDLPSPSDPGQSSEAGSPLAVRARDKWRPQAAKTRVEEDEEDVPDSLILDMRAKATPSQQPLKAQVETVRARAEQQWKTAQEQQGLYTSRMGPRSSRQRSRPSRSSAPARPLRPNPHSNAMWLYTNASNLDAFLLEVYQYYVQHGVWSILLSRALTLLTQLFIFTFAMFLSTCIDYSKIPGSKSTAEVMIPRCMAKASWFKNVLVFFFIVYWLFTVVKYGGGVRRLFQVQEFYLHVLNISDQDIQTVSWPQIVEGLVKVQNANVVTAADPSTQAKKYLDYKQPKQRLNAESIANSLMRKDNYYVAMYNKDLLDFTLPIPFLGTRQFYSKSLEWCIDTCFTNFIFDEPGNIREFATKVSERDSLVQALSNRLRVAALLAIVIAPWNIGYYCIVYFFKYYTEFTRNPSRASGRTFTPYAEWKIREFNELPHLFYKRLRQAGPFATEYLKQFPKDKTDQICKFVAFVSGALAAVLTLATLFDPELFLGFEVTSGKTAVFWLGIMLGIWGLAHGMLPDENEVHEPELHMKDVILYTHYIPTHWKQRLHTEEVRSDFSAMYKLRVMIFIEEIASLVVAPWILWRNSSKTRCERIIDFFREHTVHVEGIGNQCNFAYFNFKKDPNAEDPTKIFEEPDGLRDDYFGLKDDKMEYSVQNFMQYYSHYNNRPGLRRVQGWQAPPAWPAGVPGAERRGTSPAVAGGPRTNPPTGRRSGILERSHLRSPRQGATHPSRRQPLDLLAEESGGPAGAKTTIPGVTESRLMAQDSDLQDYADKPGLALLESDTDGDDDDPGGAGAYAGVLGMATQFARAHGDKVTGPVNI